MKSPIAWIRLLFYFGSSILLLTEFYRLSLILLTIIIFAPSLMALLQSIVNWGLFLGFSCLGLGIYRILKADTPVIDLEVYSGTDLKTWGRINLFLCVILLIELLLPPPTLVKSSSFLMFSTIFSTVWLGFYSFLVIWIITYWKIELKQKSLSSVLLNKRVAIHLFFGICVAGYWLLETVSLLIFQKAISNNDSINIIYIILLILFLFNQVFLNYRVTKFSYQIYG